MNIFEPLLSNPAVLVQGITGSHGSFHTKAMLAAGTRVVAGVTPGKSGESVSGVPVYDSVTDALVNHQVEASVIFVPARFAKNAMLEAIAADIKFVICITEGVPTHDMLEVLHVARQKGAIVIGPNSPGMLIPGSCKLGIIPAAVAKQGSIAVVSRSGTLTYEAAASLSRIGLGQRYIIGIGGDRLRGLTFSDCLKAFEADGEVSSILMIGEIGGQDEQQAAEVISNSLTKPVYAYVVGHSAPQQQQLGHAGAIMGGANESASAKTAALKAAGATVADSLPELLELIKSSQSRKDIND